MFRLIGNGVCLGESSYDPGLSSECIVDDNTSCANRCANDDDCLGYEYRSLDDCCLIHYDWTPMQVCTTPVLCITGSVDDYWCYEKTTQAVYYDLEEECIGPDWMKITSLSLSFSSCLNHCSQSDEDCNYASFSDSECILWSNCTEWGLPSGSSDENVVTVGRVDFHSDHLWTAAESCYFDCDTVAHCTGDEDYLKYCFDTCDSDINCDAVLLDFDEGTESMYSSNCSTTSLALSSSLLFLKGNLLELWPSDYDDSGEEYDVDSFAMQTNMMTKVLCAGMLIIFAFCIFYKLARAATHYPHSREHLHQLHYGRVAAVIVNSAGTRSSVPRSTTNPTEVWRYLKQVTVPETSRSEDSCSICLDTLKNVATQAPCGHIYHKECIQQWLLLNPKKECPICRSKVYAAPPPGPPPFDAATEL